MAHRENYQNVVAQSDHGKSLHNAKSYLVMRLRLVTAFPNVPLQCP